MRLYLEVAVLARVAHRRSPPSLERRFQCLLIDIYQEREGLNQYRSSGGSGISGRSGRTRLHGGRVERVSGVGGPGLILRLLPNRDPRVPVPLQHQVDAGYQVPDLLVGRLPEFLVTEQFLFGRKHLSPSYGSPRSISLPIATRTRDRYDVPSVARDAPDAPETPAKGLLSLPTRALVGPQERSSRL